MRNIPSICLKTAHITTSFFNYPFVSCHSLTSIAKPANLRFKSLSRVISCRWMSQVKLEFDLTLPEMSDSATVMNDGNQMEIKSSAEILPEKNQQSEANTEDQHQSSSQQRSSSEREERKRQRGSWTSQWERVSSKL